MRDGELDALDRSTLRLWRLSNLVGWGTLGAVAATAASILTFSLWVGALPLKGMAGSIVLVAVATVVAALVDGLIVGTHVYRWPGWVAAAGFLLPAAVSLLRSSSAGPVEMLVTLITPSIAAGLAVAVARQRFRRRPKALRAPAAR